jgi:hypothetical protein
VRWAIFSLCMGTTFKAGMQEFDKQMFKHWGFSGIKDYLSTALGLKIFPFFNFQLIGAGIAGFIVWFAEWIWHPPLGAVLIFSMTLINARYGYLVSKRIKKEGFSFRRFNRTFGVITADLLLMSIIHNSIRVYGYYEPLSDILFGWLFTNKLRMIIYHMALLKLQEGGLATYLKAALFNLLKSKIGPDLVDSLQENKEESKEKE